jgi:hypothetical protein
MCSALDRRLQELDEKTSRLEAASWKSAMDHRQDPRATVDWDVSAIKVAGVQAGQLIDSPIFTLLASGVQAELLFFPNGHWVADGKHASLYLRVHGRAKVSFSLRVDDSDPVHFVEQFDGANDRGTHHICGLKDEYTKVSVVIHEVQLTNGAITQRFV